MNTTANWIQSALDRIEQIRVWALFVLRECDSAEGALKDLLRLRKAAKIGLGTVNLEQLIAEIATNNNQAAEALRAVEFERLDAGAVIAKVKSFEEMHSLNLSKTEIKRAIQRQTGSQTRFRIKKEYHER